VQPGRTSGGIEYGPASVESCAWANFYEQLFAHPYETLQPADSLTRHYICLLFALQEPSMRGMGANFHAHPADFATFGAVCPRPDSRLRNKLLKLEPDSSQIEAMVSNPGRAARIRDMEVRGTHPNPNLSL